jgi:hypothetical protein
LIFTREVVDFENCTLTKQCNNLYDITTDHGGAVLYQESKQIGNQLELTSERLHCRLTFLAKVRHQVGEALLQHGYKREGNQGLELVVGGCVLLRLVFDLMQEVALVLVPVALELLDFGIVFSRDYVCLGKVPQEVNLKKETVLIKLWEDLSILIFSVACQPLVHFLILDDTLGGFLKEVNGFLDSLAWVQVLLSHLEEHLLDCSI